MQKVFAAMPLCQAKTQPSSRKDCASHMEKSSCDWLSCVSSSRSNPQLDTILLRSCVEDDSKENGKHELLVQVRLRITVTAKSRAVLCSPWLKACR